MPHTIVRISTINLSAGLTRDSCSTTSSPTSFTSTTWDLSTMSCTYPSRSCCRKRRHKNSLGTADGHFDDGSIAMVDHRFGNGKTRLIGTFPGYGYDRAQDAPTQQFFADLLKWAGKSQHVTCSDDRIIAPPCQGSIPIFVVGKRGAGGYRGRAGCRGPMGTRARLSRCQGRCPPQDRRRGDYSECTGTGCGGTGVVLSYGD